VTERGDARLQGACRDPANLGSPPRLPAGFRGVLKTEKAISKTTIGKTAAQAAVGGLGIRNGHGPDYEVVLATIEHAAYNPVCLGGRTNLFDLSMT
jgi:hypothetical protein